MAKMKERFSQIGYLSLTQSAANALTFDGLSVFSNVLSQRGMVLHSVEYVVARLSVALLVDNADDIYFGLCGDDSLAVISMSNAEVYDYTTLFAKENGVAANDILVEMPIRRDFGMEPGGGRLVPADRVFMYVGSSSLADVATVSCRFHYTILDMSAQDYLELAQSLRVLK